MRKHTEKELLKRLENWREEKYSTFYSRWKAGDERAYKKIVELIKIFFAKEVSSGPIKEDISRPVLIEWLQGINQAATAMKDHYVMKATTQLIEMITEEKKAKLIWDATCPEIAPTWLPTAENINALSEPVRKYIQDIETNVDPQGMVRENVIMKDTIKTLERMLQKLPEITEAWADAKAKQIRVLIEDARDEDLNDPVTSLHYLGLSLDIVTSIIDDLRPNKKPEMIKK